ncbi:alpha-glucosidase, partial [bacterium M00.F.Ca.ET.156.01.1.1]
DNPPLFDEESFGLDASDVNPYGMQDHLYDKTRPENIGFLKRFRALLDEYEGRATVGEVGDSARSLKTVAAYTSGNDKLNMCYTFDLLGPDFT